MNDFKKLKNDEKIEIFKYVNIFLNIKLKRDDKMKKPKLEKPKIIKKGKKLIFAACNDPGCTVTSSVGSCCSSNNPAGCKTVGVWNY